VLGVLSEVSRNTPGTTRLVRGETSSSLTARIARDRPDILARMKAGEFKSVRAAAKEAGIVRDPTPLELLQKAWAKARMEERFVLRYPEQRARYGTPRPSRISFDSVRHYTDQLCGLA
jgi:hypothetical protein